MTSMNIYMCGVGGQGIGMLSELISRSCLNAGVTLLGCDTHGLAQRGGTVVSHLRLGKGVFTPRVPVGCANLVIGLERLETQRAADLMLADNGLVVFYDAMYQPIHVRGNLKMPNEQNATYPKMNELTSLVSKKNGRLEKVFVEELQDPRMQNVALLGKLAALTAIEGVSVEHYKLALSETMPAHVLEINTELFNQVSQEGSK